MIEDRGWMYGDWKKVGAHTKEWMNKTHECIDCAFSLSNNHGVKCSCNKYRNIICDDKRTLTLHLCKVGFMLGYELWTHHGEPVRQTALVAEDDDKTGDDRMDEMLDVIRQEFETNSENPPIPEVQKFFDIVRASE
jgi:hypothetical protein